MNNETGEHAYPAPVDQLLSLGKPKDNESLDYSALGVSSVNTPDLIRMATDERLSQASGNTAAVWAAVHAWRALGRLRAQEAVAPLLSLLTRIDEFDDDWVQTDLPHALGQIGAGAIEPAAGYLADPDQEEWARIAASDVLTEIGRAHPDLRAECVAKLAAQLEKFSEQSDLFNAFLVSALWDLQAVEAMPLIERAYAAESVDESVTGDLEDVQIRFGLKTEREHPPKPNRLTELADQIASHQEYIRAIEEENADLRAELDDLTYGPAPVPYVAPPKIGRNEPCSCGSRKKYKKCCGA